MAETEKTPAWVPQWQPFDTAPKDGSTILAYDGDDGGGIFNGIVCARWCEAEPDDEWESEWDVFEIGGDCLHGCNLTYWMPLPPAPEHYDA